MNNDSKQSQSPERSPDMDDGSATQQEYQSRPTLPPVDSDQVSAVPLPKKSRWSLSTGKVILLVGLVLLVIAGSVGLFSFVRTNQIATDKANATGTATSKANATALAKANATATTIAQATATATAIVPLRATAIAANNPPYPPFQGSLVRGNPLGGSQSLSARAGESTVQTYFDPTYNSKNYIFQIQMMIVSGDGSHGGIVFRAGPTFAYAFDIDTSGAYTFSVLDSTGERTLSSGISPAIKTGLNQSNVLAVVAQGSTFDLYVNLQHVASVSDSTSSEGGIGILILAPHNPARVDFSDAKVWIV